MLTLAKFREVTAHLPDNIEVLADGSSCDALLFSNNAISVSFDWWSSGCAAEFKGTYLWTPADALVEILYRDSACQGVTHRLMAGVRQVALVKDALVKAGFWIVS